MKFAQTFDMATSISSIQAFNFPFILRLQCDLHVGNERKMCQALCDIDGFTMFVIHTRNQLMEIDSKRTNSKSLEDQHMDLLSRFMGLPMQQKERSFEHVDKNKKQEGFSNGFLQDIVISFILVQKDTTYASCSQHQFYPHFVSFKFCLKDLSIGPQHFLSFVL